MSLLQCEVCRGTPNMILIVSISLTFLRYYGLCEWVALTQKTVDKPTKTIVIRNTSLFPEWYSKMQNEADVYRGKLVLENHLLPEQVADTAETRETPKDDFPCPDIHNFTMMWHSKEDHKPDIPSLPQLPLEELKEFQVNVKQNLPRSAAGKYAFLKSLEDELTSNIESRIRDLAGAGDRRARGKFSFPAEGALISISLLLFAVYLIKLVMKILKTLHEKKTALQNGASNTISINGVQYRLPTGMTVPVGRKRRDLEAEMQQLQMLELIEKYSLRFQNTKLPHK